MFFKNVCCDRFGYHLYVLDGLSLNGLGWSDSAVSARDLDD